jgi:predicted TIM-barrel fold metal-dependent hydrolase
MIEPTASHGGNKSSVERRDFLKAGMASMALALCPGRVLGLPENPAAIPTKIIDIHAHITTLDTQRYPIAPLDGKRPDWSKERPVTFEVMTADMDDAGIYKAALVHSSTTYSYDCSYLADSVARDPKRFAGVFSVNMMADDASDKIRYWATQRKLSGLRLFANVDQQQSAWLSDPKTFTGLECAQSLGLPVCVSLRMPNLPQLQAIVKQFPKIRFIVDHMLQPPVAEGIPYSGSQYLFDLAEYQNVYLKLTSVNIQAFRTGKGSPETFFPPIVNKFGASRIAWGSNYPASEGTLKEIVLQAQSALAVLSAQDREWIFARTAQSLYPVLADR